MSLAINLTRDDISPALARLASPALMDGAAMAAGMAVVALGQRAFTEPGLRPTAWVARKDRKAHALLLLTGTMRQSLHVQSKGAAAVQIRSATPYAAAHQLGSKKRNIPARPFLPVTEAGLTEVAKREIREVVADVLR
jgi:phage gpG-like protein